MSALTSKQAVGLSGRGRNVRRLTTNSNIEPSSSSGESVVATPTPRHVLSSYERFVVRITRSYSGTDIPTTMGYDFVIWKTCYNRSSSTVKQAVD